MEVAVGLVERADEQRGGLDELFVLLLLLVRGEAAADVEALVVGQNHSSYREELLHYLP